MFIKTVTFRNVKVLRNTVLPLQPFTLLIGPNGSGKTTAIDALYSFGRGPKWNQTDVLTVGVDGEGDDRPAAEIFLEWTGKAGQFDLEGLGAHMYWQHPRNPGIVFTRGDSPAPDDLRTLLNQLVHRFRYYSLDAHRISEPVELQPRDELLPDGARLAGVLDRLRDDHPERFESLNAALANWLPEYDRILFDTPQPGRRAIALRTRTGGHKIDAPSLSQGTLIALALLTLAYLPEPPILVLLEEPDRGLHPRLLRDIRDALYRLTDPRSVEEDREPVQVVATTHSPYFLDLYRDCPEQIVIAEKRGNEAVFSRLADRSDLEALLQDTPLSDLWYSGILGGVPTD